MRHQPISRPTSSPLQPLRDQAQGLEGQEGEDERHADEKDTRRISLAMDWVDRRPLSRPPGLVATLKLSISMQDDVRAGYDNALLVVRHV